MLGYDMWLINKWSFSNNNNNNFTAIIIVESLWRDSKFRLELYLSSYTIEEGGT